MSLLIKGMNMPKDGRKHKALILFEGDGTARAIVEYSQSYDERHMTTFDVVDVPTPHGRLIDADALYELFVKEAREKQSVFASLAAFCIELAPTVIEAEE